MRIGSWVPLICGVVSVVVLAGSGVFYSRLMRPGPAVPAEPEATEGGETVAPIPLTGDQRCTAAFYGQLIKADAERFGIVPSSAEAMGQPLHGGSEWQGEFVFTKKHKVLETPHLHISSGTQKLYPDPKSGLGIRAEHLTLSIRNRTGVPIAYRVATRVTGQEDCTAKAACPTTPSPCARSKG